MINWEIVDFMRTNGLNFKWFGSTSCIIKLEYLNSTNNLNKQFITIRLMVSFEPGEKERILLKLNL